VPVAALPGLATPSLASIGSILSSTAGGNPTPTAAISGRPGNTPPQPINQGIDGWFLDRLFGRH